MTSPNNSGDLYTNLATTGASNIDVNAMGSTTRPLPTANGSSYNEIKPFTVAQIKGEMFTIEKTDRELFPEMSILNSDEIKRFLVQYLLEKMMKSNCIEFTKQSNPNTMDYTYRARIFAVPNADVQLIRKQEINENV